MLECVPCTLEHIEQLKPRMREADRVELELATGQSPEFILEESFRVSEHTFTFLEDGLVLCVFGVSSHPQMEGAGIPWLIASDEAEAKGKSLVRYCKEKIDLLSAPYRVLLNMVHAENKVAIRWLIWCGFKFLPAVEVGPKNALFMPFIKECKNV